MAKSSITITFTPKEYELLREALLRAQASYTREKALGSPSKRQHAHDMAGNVARLRGQL